MGHLTRSKEPARMGIHNYEELAFEVRGFSYVKNLQYHMQLFYMCLEWKKKYTLSCAG